MKKQELNERLFDELLKFASEDYVEHIDSQWPSEEEPDSEHTFSEEFNNKMDLIFTEQKKRESIIKIKQSLVKVAVIILLVFTASLFTVMTVEALRVRILNYFIERSERSTTFFTDHESSDVTLNADYIALPKYLPSGYSKASLNFMDDYYMAIYQDASDNEIYLYKVTSDFRAGVDSEDAYLEHLIVNDQPAEYYKKNNMGTLIYKHKGEVFILGGSLLKDELVKIAESMN